MGHIGSRNQDPLLSCQPPGLADIVKSLDLFIDPADGLNPAVLVDRAGYRKGLLERDLRNGGEQRIELRRRGAVPFHAAVGLLEHQAGGQGQGPVHRIPSVEKPGQDQHPLGMNGAAHGRLPFDVHHIALAQMHPGGDFVGLAEGEFTQLHHRQTVDLGHLFSLGVDQDDIPLNLLMHGFPNPVRAVELGIDRLLHRLGVHHRIAVFAGPEIRLSQQVGHRPHENGDLLLVFQHSGAVLNHPGYSAPVKGLQFFFVDDGGEQPGIVLFILRISVHAEVEIRGHLEQVRKFRIIVADHVIKHRAAQQNHFYI